MRKLFLLLVGLLLGLCSPSAYAAVCSSTSLGNGATCKTSTSAIVGSTACTLAAMSVAAGDTLIGLGNSDSLPASNTLGLSDTDSDSWTAVGPVRIGSTVVSEMWVATAKATNASEVFHFTASSGANHFSCDGAVISGGYTVLDQQSTASNSATQSLTSGASSSTTSAIELVIGGFGVGGVAASNRAAGSGYTSFDGNNSGTDDNLLEGKTVTSTGAQTATATTSTNVTATGFVITLAQPASTVVRHNAQVITQ